VIVGLLLEKRIEMIFDSFRLVGITLLITGILLLLTNIYKGRAKKDKVASSNWKDALFVGIFQALAILPGISRSGATISAGLFRKFDRNLAFKFSFFLIFLMVQPKRCGTGQCHGEPIKAIPAYYANTNSYVFILIF